MDTINKEKKEREEKSKQSENKIEKNNCEESNKNLKPVENKKEDILISVNLFFKLFKG